jgi:hypothetical protein
LNSFRLFLFAAKLADLNHAFGRAFGSIYNLIFDLIASKFSSIAPLFTKILILSDLGPSQRHILDQAKGKGPNPGVPAQSNFSHKN